MNNSNQILFLPHGGGPLPVLVDKNHRHLTEFLKTISNKLEKPEAIVIISGHWEEDKVTITSGNSPDMIYDYGGFPEESYNLKYPASGNQEFANDIYYLLKENNIETVKDSERGYDHGMYIPLMLMYPKADIPCIQISLNKNLDPKFHIKLGKVLSKLKDRNILFIGSGMTFHNMKWFFYESNDANEKAESFNNWLIETITDNNLSASEKENRMINWENAPEARFSHPREEHLIPLHVCFGIASLTS